MMFTAEEIAAAKLKMIYSSPKDIRHEHDDCIRMAYEWLDAQEKTRGVIRHAYPLKHLIERWAGRYVSRSDVEVAATMHCDIRGEYPYFNISKRLTWPADERLIRYGEARKHYRPLSDEAIKATYARREGYIDWPKYYPLDEPRQPV